MDGCREDFTFSFLVVFRREKPYGQVAIFGRGPYHLDLIKLLLSFLLEVFIYCISHLSFVVFVCMISSLNIYWLEGKKKECLLFRKGHASGTHS